MTENSQFADQEVLRFIFERIASVPHLEALLLIWDTRPKPWSVNELAQRLYVDRKIALALLQDLTRQNLIVADSGSSELYFYESRMDQSDNGTNTVVSPRVVTVSTMLHRKASLAIRDFADAFRFTKEHD